MTAGRRPAAPGPAQAGGLVEGISPGSLAERAGLRPGDRILSLDGHSLRDVIDYRFYAAEEHLELTAARDGACLTIALDKHPDEDLGLRFAEPTFDGVRACNNNCFFCFLKGLPKGLRRSLYVKDDDYRLSFLHGNFVTLTNLTEEDWWRIGEQRLSPLNVSVHATEPALRRRLLGNPRAPDILPQLRRLADLGITVDAQVVVCPGVNDGAHLARTVEDLAGLHPAVRSVAVVPVGATRQGEERIARAGQSAEVTPCTPDRARALLRQVHAWQRDFRRRWGPSFVYAADEYYLTAGARPPSATRYDGYPQFENGVGLVRSLVDDWRRTRRRAPRRESSPGSYRRISLVCGTLIAPVLAALAAELSEVCGLRTDVFAVENRFFGPRVTVSGLLVAEDIVGALGETSPGDLVVLPRSALDYAGEHFLDGGTPEVVEAVVGAPVAFARTLSDVLTLITGQARGRDMPRWGQASAASC